MKDPKAIVLKIKEEFLKMLKKIKKVLGPAWNDVRSFVND